MEGARASKARDKGFLLQNALNLGVKSERVEMSLRYITAAKVGEKYTDIGPFEILSFYCRQNRGKRVRNGRGSPGKLSGSCFLGLMLASFEVKMCRNASGLCRAQNVYKRGTVRQS